jgi:Ca2+-binding RTX toxin-like protein
MITRTMPRLFFILLVTLIVLSIISAFAATIDVPTTYLTDQVQAITANTLKPSACSGLNLRRIEICTGGNCNASGTDELIIGTTGSDTIRGKNGDDCIIGGGGDDFIYGDNGSDMCIGGPGNDDVSDNSCETQIQDN